MAYISVLLVALAVTTPAAAIAPTIEAGPGGIVVQFGTFAVRGLLSSSTIYNFFSLVSCLASSNGTAALGCLASMQGINSGWQWLASPATLITPPISITEQGSVLSVQTVDSTGAVLDNVQVATLNDIPTIPDIDVPDIVRNM